LNSLVDADVISALYRASQQGVKIDLLIRGICCLKPGVKGVSEGIRVHAVVDRFLEHARIFHFRNDGEDEVFCSSADWMPRNFRRRVELMFPVLDPTLKKRCTEEILATMCADTAKSWKLESDGRYVRVSDGTDSFRSQQRFMDLARERARESETILALGSRPMNTAPSPRDAFEKIRRKGRKKRKRDKRRD
jgi:polyphosphate kinase